MQCLLVFFTLISILMPTSVTGVIEFYIQVIPTQMKKVLEDGTTVNASPVVDVAVDPIVRGFIRNWDAMEDLLHHVLYTGLGWEMGNEGQILFADPLLTPKVKGF